MNTRLRRQAAALFLLCALLTHAAVRAAEAPALMLAEVYQQGTSPAEYWVSEKLDGVRGRWDGAQLHTRGGHRIAAPAWFTEGWPEAVMDGELWIDRNRFDEVSGIVRAHAAGDAAWRQVRFMVFDLPQHGGRFEARVQAMRERIEALDIDWLKPVPQFRVEDEVELQTRLEEIVAAGGEGLMLHHRDARYRPGRNPQLLKLKPFDDDEARVIDHLPGQGKYEGQMGALLVERSDGLRFRLGTGFSDAQRADPPAIGTWVTYRHNGLTPNGVPRFARFLRQRHELPPPDPQPEAAFPD
jgi:DNA ligase-1